MSARPRRRSARSRRMSFAASLGITAAVLLMVLLVAYAWQDAIPYWVAGANVVGLGGLCWLIEAVSRA